MNLERPYLLYLGDKNSPLTIKTSRGIAEWRPDLCIGEFYSGEADLSLGLENMTIAEAAKKGARTFVVGVANSGGIISETWIAHILNAIENGLDIASGLHQRLSDIPSIRKLAESKKVQLHDIRHFHDKLTVGKGSKRSGKRLLTVGTDCSVGKMYTSLALEKEMKKQGFDAEFIATGQTGIFIKGSGISIDAVIADFISGAVEMISPAKDENHWDLIEGQGSLFNPSFAGVSTGLLHGAQADRLVLCHEAGRTEIKDLSGFKIPTLHDCMEANLKVASLTNSNVEFAGISLNCRKLDREEALREMEKIENEFKLPCVDPMINGVSKIVENLTS